MLVFFTTRRMLEWIRVTHWLENEMVVFLYGLRQSSLHELSFMVELGPCVISLHGIITRFILVWAPGPRSSWT
uniref:Putative ovule protein n=2 Tax=Solanum chacoense TaxID=4108 RepID=A0A0V0I3D1_SOLCH